MKTKQIHFNDLKGPRMKKAKFSRQIVTKELWKEFVAHSTDYKHITWPEFYSAWMDIAQTIRNETITNPLGVKLPSYTGELKLQYLPHKFEATDMSTSAKLGKKVKFVGLVTNGRTAKLKWERRWAVKFNKILQFFAFEPTRELGRMAGKHIDKHPEKLRVARNTLGGWSVWRQLKKDR